MAIRFNKLIRPGRPDTQNLYIAEHTVRAKATVDTLLFMSHKTGDRKAEVEADYISNKYRVHVYMAEWYDSISGDPYELPDYIMEAIRKSDGFLVNVIAEIAVSMWIGYEIGGAHAMQKPRAKLVYNNVPRLPSVVNALSSLRNRHELDRWIVNDVLQAQSRLV